MRTLKGLDLVCFTEKFPNSQKQLFANVLQNRCYEKFRKIHRETPVPEFLFQ